MATFDVEITMTNTNHRCLWCNTNPLYVAYHDNEWGKVVFNDHKLFVQLCLEGMQTGLSWITVLQKRANYYQAFDGFDIEKITKYDSAKVDELMQNTSIIRHRAKIEAIIHNAKMYQKITQHQPFGEYLWGFVRQFGQFPCDNLPKTPSDVPTVSDVSKHLSKQLKKDGFKFVGATTCYAFMQAVGMVNDHVVDCAYREQK